MGATPHRNSQSCYAGIELLGYFKNFVQAFPLLRRGSRNFYERYAARKPPPVGGRSFHIQQFNQVALSKLIADQIGAGYGDEVGAIVEASLNGDALSIADASVALCESIAENLGIKAEAEQSGILGFFAKVMDFFNRIARMIVDLFKSFGAKVAA